MAVLQVLTSTLRKYLSSFNFFRIVLRKHEYQGIWIRVLWEVPFTYSLIRPYWKKRDGTLFLLNIGKYKKSTQTGLLAILGTVLKWIVIIGKNFVNIGKKSIIAKTAEKT